MEVSLLMPTSNPTVVGLEDLRTDEMVCLQCLGFTEKEAYDLWFIDDQLLLCRRDEALFTCGVMFTNGRHCDECGKEVVLPYYACVANLS